MEELQKSLQKTLTNLKLLQSNLSNIQLEPSKLSWEEFISNIGNLSFQYQTLTNGVDNILKNNVAFPLKIESPDNQRGIQDFINPIEVSQLQSEMAHDKEVFEQYLSEHNIANESVQEKEELHSLLTANYNSHQELCENAIQTIEKMIQQTHVTEFPQIQIRQTANADSGHAILRAIDSGEGLPLPPDFNA